VFILVHGVLSLNLSAGWVVQRCDISSWVSWIFGAVIGPKSSHRNGGWQISLVERSVVCQSGFGNSDLKGQMGGSRFCKYVYRFCFFPVLPVVPCYWQFLGLFVALPWLLPMFVSWIASWQMLHVYTYIYIYNIYIYIYNIMTYINGDMFFMHSCVYVFTVFVYILIYIYVYACNKSHHAWSWLNDLASGTTPSLLSIPKLLPHKL
jgi:hypothetical protein